MGDGSGRQLTDSQFSIAKRDALSLFFKLLATNRKLRLVDLPPLVRVTPIQVPFLPATFFLKLLVVLRPRKNRCFARLVVF